MEDTLKKKLKSSLTRWFLSVLVVCVFLGANYQPPWPYVLIGVLGTFITVALWTFYSHRRPA